jgi:hypothetical protein
MINKQKKILNLLVTIGGIQYVLGTLRFNTEEFSYFFTYPSDSPEVHLNCDTGEHTSRLEHITWHNGRIHIKRKDNVAVAAMHYSGSLLTDPPVLTPLYIESFYFNNVPCLIKTKEFIPWKGSLSQEILSLDVSEGFSLVFLLVPSKYSTYQILKGFQFADIPEGLFSAPSLADLCNLKHRPGRIAVWENWDVVVVVTPFVQSTLYPISSAIGPCRLPNYRNVLAGLTDLMLQANGLTKPKCS